MTYRVLKLTVSLLVWAFIRPQVTGRENIPRRGPVILASNHISFFDSVIIPIVAPRQVTFLAKEEYFTGRGVKGRLSRWFFTTMGHVPVARDDPRAGERSLGDALEVLSAGGAFGIYPEGTRSRDGLLHAGKTGVAYLALRGQAPIVPVGVDGTQAVQPVGAKFPRPPWLAGRFGIRVQVHFGVPIDSTRQITACPPAAKRRELTEEVMSAIGELSGQKRA